MFSMLAVQIVRNTSLVHTDHDGPLPQVHQLLLDYLRLFHTHGHGLDLVRQIRQINQYIEAMEQLVLDKHGEDLVLS